MFNFISYLTEDNAFKWDLEDEITDETLIVYKGEIRKT
jgi:NAD(P) transhydrogenase subunit alpha